MGEMYKQGKTEGKEGKRGEGVRGKWGGNGRSVMTGTTCLESLHF